MATHFSILAWINPWTEEPGRLQSICYTVHRRRSLDTSEHPYMHELHIKLFRI